MLAVSVSTVVYCYIYIPTYFELIPSLIYIFKLFSDSCTHIFTEQMVPLLFCFEVLKTLWSGGSFIKSVQYFTYQTPSSLNNQYLQLTLCHLEVLATVEWELITGNTASIPLLTSAVPWSRTLTRFLNLWHRKYSTNRTWSCMSNILGHHKRMVGF